MELVPALLTVGGSYVSYLLAWRRIRAGIGRRRGPDLQALAIYDHAGLSRELRAIAAEDPSDLRGLTDRSVAQSQARRAEALPPGPKRDAAARACLSTLRLLGDEALRTPVWSGLAAHMEVLRLSLWSVEWGELTARRRLQKALARHPDEPALHLIRAHLAAVLGDAEGAADHLARALYYAKGEAFYARPIVASPFITRFRPALAAQARALESPRPILPLETEGFVRSTGPSGPGERTSI